VFPLGLRWCVGHRSIRRGMGFGLLLLLSLRLYSAPDGRAYFFLSCQEKVAKKKARPAWRPLRGFPALLGWSGGCGTRLRLRQSSPFSAPPSVARRRTGQANQNRPEPDAHAVSIRGGSDLSPLDAAEQRRRAGGCRRGLSEPQASSAAARHVEQRRAPRRGGNAGSPFLWLLSFGEAKESKPARQGRNTAQNQTYKPTAATTASTPAASTTSSESP
jgi:hypothetical protein